MLAVVEELQIRVAAMGVPNQHGLWGTDLKVLLPSDQARLNQFISASGESLHSLVQASSELGIHLSISAPSDLMESDEIINVAHRVVKRLPIWRIFKFNLTPGMKGLPT